MNQKTAKLIRRAARNMGWPHRAMKANWNCLKRTERRAMRVLLESVARSA